MKTLIWKGIAYESLEYFTLRKREDYTVESTIIGCYQDYLYTVNYQLAIDKDWKILEFMIESEINTIKNKITGRKLHDEWEINTVIDPDFKDFTFIDISLTPFTNTLPVNNLQLQENTSRVIDVIYIDVLNNNIRPVQQQYTRKNGNNYLYENLENDFKANVLFDEEGLVTEYHQLFKKIAVL
ncbi:hypothetical protein EGY07_03685 [Chryseobacterium indologenes]|uniref:putative glycolipid-binding domain-containing protein n=1 Tax=Chryseobacterium indologenes TaxID=253 RepID=UPI000B5195C2|nr:putative glycolipid-binding domain-containing protein [Chryseobacterium indologenes]ASE62348.1 hypothetical protein CEQ15_13005 [Chryseobacterium indologenes]ATN06181.1 hypothetical protein CRN76_12600 [Chryseobacterium indologenes]AYY85059.1 hypothetical protein EGX91_11140 [Chryseobacterium indologenes]AYZ34730.1 hypothetical protein EGY07_03685 [Chryseobacterium indologenes]MBF6643314.1 putative glycolipid-binding domain-containing protein [Chryseobacterium indologenes]